MKRRATSIARQLNLSLITAPALTVSPDKQQELQCALVELLTNAASAHADTRDHRRGTDDESQTHR